MNKKDFSRERKQTFPGTILFLLNNLTKSVSLEIMNFVNHIRQYDSTQKVFTQSAFSQMRKKIKPEVFIHLIKVLVDEFYTDNDNVKTILNNFRVLAIDGSSINLPRTKELQEIYGVLPHSDIVQAKISVVYDVLNRIAINAIISPSNANERTQALELIKDCKKGDLLIYDRGYPSFDFIYAHVESDLDYVMRVKRDLNNQVKSFISSGKKSLVTEFNASDRLIYADNSFSKESKIKVRLVRVELGNNNIEVLVTSLLDEQEYKHEIFKELYFHRWKIETYYNELKSKLRIEVFSGYSNISILQDFYSTILVSNLQSIVTQEVNDELPQNRKYQYKVNTSKSYGVLKNRVIDLLLSRGCMDKAYEEIKILFMQNLIPIRPGRTSPRKIQKNRVKAHNKSPENHKINT